MTGNFCACGCRLSVADTDGRCIHCHDDPKRFELLTLSMLPPVELPRKNGQPPGWVLARDEQGRKLCRCGRGPVIGHATCCPACQRERSRAYRARRKGERT